MPGMPGLPEFAFDGDSTLDRVFAGFLKHRVMVFRKSGPPLVGILDYAVCVGSGMVLRLSISGQEPWDPPTWVLVPWHDVAEVEVDTT